MKNRPLCSLCLVIAILIGILTAGAGAKFVSELRPSPVEQYGEKDDWLIVRGQVYKKEVKEIVQNYDVDGIHMDDYFYPSFTKRNVKKAFDAKEYKKSSYKKKKKSIRYYI